MNKNIKIYFTGLGIIVGAFLVIYNNTHFKPNESPSLKKTKVTYTEIHQSTFNQSYENVNFTRNGDAVAIFDSSEIVFYDLNRHKPIKKIQTRDEMSFIIYGKSRENGKKYLLFIDGFARIFNTQNWQIMAEFEIEKGTKNNPNFSNNGARLYIGNSLWNIETGKLIVNGIRSRSPADSDFSDNNRYFLMADSAAYPTLVDMKSVERLDTLPVIHRSEQVMFRDNSSYYIDYGRSGGPFTKTLGLFSVQPPTMLAEITPYKRISCWTRLKNDKRLVMSLVDGALLVLDEKLNVLAYWPIGKKALKCTGGTNGRVWLATGLPEPTETLDAYDLYEVNINQKTIARPIQIEGTIKHLAVSPDGKHIALVNRVSKKTLARIYLNSDM